MASQELPVFRREKSTGLSSRLAWECLKNIDLSIPPAVVSLRSRNGATCFFGGQKSMQKTLWLLMLLWKNYGGGKPAAIQTRP